MTSFMNELPDNCCVFWANNKMTDWRLTESGTYEIQKDHKETQKYNNHEGVLF